MKVLKTIKNILVAILPILKKDKETKDYVITIIEVVIVALGIIIAAL